MFKRAKKEATFRPLEQPVAQSAPIPTTTAHAGVPAEVVAAISGAVAMLYGGSAQIVGIQPAGGNKAGARAQSGRSAWSMAGLLDSTRAF